MMAFRITKLFLLFCLWGFLVRFSLATIPTEYSILSHDVDTFPSEERAFQLFQQWQKEHARNYQNLEEMANRFQIFQRNLKHITETNAKRKSSLELRLGLNKFSDMSPEEFKEKYLQKQEIPAEWGNYKELKDETCEDAPASIDWREKGAVTEVKDQGNCSKCFNTIPQE